MIYTLTLNPSVDYIAKVDGFEEGKLNRTKEETFLPGGKGINVSRVLTRLGVANKALGFAGGFTGDFIRSFLNDEGVLNHFISVPTPSRINLKLKSQKETELNGNGPIIPNEHLQELFVQIQELNNRDTLILAGSIPKSVPSTTYKDIAELCQSRDVRFVIDAEKGLLSSVLANHPYLVKPNHHELGEIYGTNIESVKDAIHYGRLMLKDGAVNVMVSMGEQGAVFLNKDHTLVAKVPNRAVKSTVGAGDSTVAGFMASIDKNHSMKHAFQFAVASGSATAFSLDLCTRQKIVEIYDEIRIETGEGQ
ncbi:1-phosphofructokinase [Bacillus pakistanensis]|uniref:Tagatose-6-phosphate kinase n=1 Tax=Rossellomorea pakistanensis TaxID=992288 RepID=A0ABS2N8J9_9BACI|nr:1-phosphofructokinase [Bacillus pakistanensis]MBM7584174.1 1-phosphofructokinase [Bacillus pakistanensis]